MCKSTSQSFPANDETKCNEAKMDEREHPRKERRARRRRQRKAARSWGRSIPSTCNERHFLAIGAEIDAEVTAELEEELVNLQKKTALALSETYAEVDRRRKEKDDAVSFVQGLEEELARLTQEKAEQKCAQPAESMPTSEISARGIRRSCSLFLKTLHAETKEILHRTETERQISPMNQPTSFEFEKETSVEKLNEKLLQLAATEENLFSRHEENEETLRRLTAICNELSDLRVCQSKAKSEGRVNAPKMNEEIVMLSSGIKNKDSLLSSDSSCTDLVEMDPLSSYAEDRKMRQLQNRRSTWAA